MYGLLSFGNETVLTISRLTRSIFETVSLSRSGV